MRVTGLDHIVLAAADVEVTVAWYHEVLGLPTERLEEFRRGEVFFPSLRLNDTTIIDVFGRGDAPTGQNLDHFAMVVTDVDLDDFAASGRVEVVDGPGPRWGAQGDGRSIYVKDPDGTTVELRTYG